MHTRSYSVLIATLLAASANAVSPLVTLPYSQYQGVALSSGISQWLGVRFAAPPLGDLRFQAPQDPLAEYGIQQADKHGKICLPVGGGPPSNTTDEDCLFLDVYAPSHATLASKLPVFVFIQGGGFASNANPNLNGTGLIEASGKNIIVVTSNYRVGPYGFLASEEVAKDGSVNNGLKDQRKVFQWVQKYIRQFGGDPNHVVLGGDSAGGQSVALHLTAFGGRDEGLFIGAAGESISSPTMYTVAGSQSTYDNLVVRTGCVGQETLACLRNLSATALQEQNFVIPFPGGANPPLYGYGPTLDNDLVPDLTYRLFEQGHFIKVPTILGDDTNGGTIFAPKNTSSYAQSDQFLRDNFPYLKLAELSKIQDLYPVADFPQHFPDSGPYWRQAASAYGDLRYKCPGTFFSSALAAQKTKGKTARKGQGRLAAWNYRYNVRDAAQVAEGLGVPHTVEVNAIFGPTNVQGNVAPASYFPGGANAHIVPEIQAYWTSFIRTLDPNVHRLEGSVKWEQWTRENQERLLFQVEPATVMERVSEGDREKCAFFNGIGVALRQ